VRGVVLSAEAAYAVQRPRGWAPGNGIVLIFRQRSLIQTSAKLTPGARVDIDRA
jgi:hypothetical protein